MPGPETKDAILDAAERLLGQHGYAAMSLRMLTTAADVNLAAVNYHFGSKEDLTKAALARRIAPINAERLRMLDEAERPRSVAAIVRAFIEPPLRSTPAEKRAPRKDQANPQVCRVLGRIMVEQPPFLREFLIQQFRDVARRFQAALAEALPEHEAATLWWRLHFLYGALSHTLQNPHMLAMMTDTVRDGEDIDATIEHLVAFATGGLGAAAVSRSRKKVVSTGNKRRPGPAKARRRA
jgi:AcrR family transcriptional regulator